MVVRDPADPEDRASTSASTGRNVRSDHSPWNWLLLLPLVVTLFPPIYNSIDPTLFDIPFFYWYQLAAIALSVVVTLLVYRKTRA
jgi:hypothetical protein